MPHVLVAGPASWNTLVDVDAFPEPHPHMVMARGHREGLGGTSAGKALTLARLGVPVTLWTSLGDDLAAERITGALAHPELTLVARRRPGASERHLNLMRPDGGRLSIYLDVPPDPGPPPHDVLLAARTADVVVADLAAPVRAALPLLTDGRAEVWCDVHDHDGVADFHRPFVEAADVLVVSADRLPDPRAFLGSRVAAGTRWAVCTDGARGAVALGRDEGWLQVPAVPAGTVVDANGAGDAFVAGMLRGRLDGLPLADCLRLGAAAGTLAVRSPDLVADATLADVRRLAGP
ncbi:carbohydrate kinase family protein [Actinotalea ferrariae]|uniref:carbohydrate kinase family protein n=1 Tax=Actinotalea ferrariae TaxID=1386098 RepID=UPI001C8CB1EB|nr:PfkB family carbohydrate kinase [Actinotalea ferrariae]MBX9243343.1 carbohydrate kinase family protein [Actinotalea ferrariae]